MSNSRWLYQSLLPLSLLGSVLFIGVLFYTPFGDWVRKLSTSSPSKIMGVVSGAINPKGPWVEVTKWKRGRDIEIRVVISQFNEVEQTEPRVQDFMIQKAYDGHTYLNNNVTNVAIVNVDEDEWAEIIIPFFEASLAPRLYVLKYDPIIGQFIRVNDRD